MVLLTNKLTNDVKSIGRDYGTFKKISYSLPGSAQLCLFDLREGVKGKILDTELIDSYPLIKDSIKDGVKKNAFILSQNTIESYYIGDFEINHYPYFKCLQSTAGKVELGIEGTGKNALIITEFETTITLDPDKEISGKTEDGVVELIIPKGTIATHPTGPVTKISIKMVEKKVTGQKATDIYEFKPSGTTFEPPIDLKIKYNPNEFEGCPIALSFYQFNEDESPKPEILSEKIDCDNHIATFNIDGFSLGVAGPPGQRPAVAQVATTGLENGKLYQSPEGPEIYYVQDNKPRWVTTIEIFNACEFEWNNVNTIPQSVIGDLETIKADNPIDSQQKCPPAQEAEEEEAGTGGPAPGVACPQPTQRHKIFDNTIPGVTDQAPVVACGWYNDEAYIQARPEAGIGCTSSPYNIHFPDNIHIAQKIVLGSDPDKCRGNEGVVRYIKECMHKDRPFPEPGPLISEDVRAQIKLPCGETPSAGTVNLFVQAYNDISLAQCCDYTGLASEIERDKDPTNSKTKRIYPHTSLVDRKTCETVVCMNKKTATDTTEHYLSIYTGREKKDGSFVEGAESQCNDKANKPGHTIEQKDIFLIQVCKPPSPQGAVSQQDLARVKNNWDCPGNDIPPAPLTALPTISHCIYACQQDSSCVGISYQSTRTPLPGCWKKSALKSCGQSSTTQLWEKAPAGTVNLFVKAFNENRLEQCCPYTGEAGDFEKNDDVYPHTRTDKDGIKCEIVVCRKSANNINHFIWIYTGKEIDNNGKYVPDSTKCAAKKPEGDLNTFLTQGCGIPEPAPVTCPLDQKPSGCPVCGSDGRWIPRDCDPGAVVCEEGSTRLVTRCEEELVAPEVEYILKWQVCENSQWRPKEKSFPTADTCDTERQTLMRGERAERGTCEAAGGECFSLNPDRLPDVDASGLGVCAYLVSTRPLTGTCPQSNQYCCAAAEPPAAERNPCDGKHDGYRFCAGSNEPRRINACRDEQVVAPSSFRRWWSDNCNTGRVCKPVSTTDHTFDECERVTSPPPQGTCSDCNIGENCYRESCEGGDYGNCYFTTNNRCAAIIPECGWWCSPSECTDLGGEWGDITFPSSNVCYSSELEPTIPASRSGVGGSEARGLECEDDRNTRTSCANYPCRDYRSGCTFTSSCTCDSSGFYACEGTCNDNNLKDLCESDTNTIRICDSSENPTVSGTVTSNYRCINTIESCYEVPRSVSGTPVVETVGTHCNEDRDTFTFCNDKPCDRFKSCTYSTLCTCTDPYPYACKKEGRSITDCTETNTPTPAPAPTPTPTPAPTPTPTAAPASHSG